jgi:hypothetical protein
MCGEDPREQEYGGLYVNYALSFWLTCMAYEETGKQRAMVKGEFLDQLNLLKPTGYVMHQQV